MAFINLIILYFVLRKVLFRPVMAYMANRTKMIEDTITNANNQKAEAMEMKATYEAQMKTAKAEGKKLIDTAVAKATAQQNKMIAEAQRQAEGILAKAREEVELERAQMLKDVRSEVASLAFAAASKVLEANLDTENNRLLVDKFIDEAGAA